MLDRIIKFLGGYTKSEYNLLDDCYSNVRNECIQLKVQYVELLKRFDSIDEERKRFQELIFAKFGVIPPETLPHDPGTYEPIRTSRPSMRETMNMMMRDDQKRVKSTQGLPDAS